MHTSGTLIDGRIKGPVKNVTIIIAGKKIKSVVAGESVPKNAVVIDASEGTVLPGLIDMHVHVGNKRQLELFLEYGVTSVRDVGNNLGKIKNFRDSVAKGKLIGPRISLRDRSSTIFLLKCERTNFFLI